MSTDYTGRRVRWLAGELCLPVERCRPGAPVVHQRVETEPGMWEITDGVLVAPGDEGTVTAHAGRGDQGDAWLIEFDRGGRLTTLLPQPHALALAPA